MMKQKKAILSFLFVLALGLLPGNNLSFAADAQASQMESEKIIGIDTSSFFSSLKHDYHEVFYVYFGRPTCLECIEFEKELNRFLDASNWVVYYYNTAYWKDDPLYERILSDYQIDSVPMLVKISSGEFESAFLYDPALSSDEIQTQLDNFFTPLGTGISSVTERSFPIQFHDRMSAIVILFLLFNALYLFAMRKDLIQKRPKFTILLVFLTSTTAVALQALIFSLGSSFAFAYEASPAHDFLSQFGRIAYLTTLPLYIFICCLCIYIKVVQSQTKND